MKRRYNKPVYSEEQYKRWDAAEEYKQKMYKEHSSESNVLLKIK